MTLYTRAGDEGETSLLFGQKLSKASPRTEAYGSLDSAISAMGLARALCKDDRVKETLLRLQRELFTVGSELATPPEDLDKLEEYFKPVDAGMTEALENEIDDLKSQVRLPRAFIVPGATAGSGAIDMARSLLRTAERRTVALSDAGELPNGEVLRYLNRLSDLLFILARYEDRELPFELTTGETGSSP